MSRKSAVTPKDIAGITNSQFWALARAKNPNFKSHTSKITSEIFTDKGFEAVARDDIGIINEFFEISLRVAFQKCDISRAKNPLAEIGLVEIYNTPSGGFTQRIAINSLKPISPKFKGLQNGMSVDPYVVRKSSSKERFFGKNFDYQSLVTNQDYQVKEILLNENGMGQFIAGIMEGLANGYIIQEYVNTKEAINAALNSDKFPLRDGQKLAVGSWTDAGATSSDLESFILTIKDLATAMKTQAQTGMYNANGFETYVDPSDYVVLMRPGIKNRIQLELEVGAFNPDRLTLPFDSEEISDFGGLVPKGDNDETLQPVFDSFGSVVGYVDALATINAPAFWDAANERWLVNITIGGATADTTFPAEPTTWSDPNAEVLAIVCQKGLIFENKQNPYSVRPRYNPAGLYTNYWASSPNNSINVDPNYNMVVITKPSN